MTKRVHPLTEDQRTVADRIEARRKELGISPTLLMEACSLDRTYYHKLKTYKQPWKWEYVRKAAPMLRKQALELWTGEEDDLNDEQRELMADAMTYCLELLTKHGAEPRHFSSRGLALVLADQCARALRAGEVDKKSAEWMVEVLRRA